jgi:hypothetical protein
MRLAVWSSVGTLCPALLPPHYVQQRAENAVRWRKRADAEYERGWEGY